ncbi:MAG: hypothetical protein H6738_22595 [Alphaproteobacteria bacterium]|nr:hypothetical protein [Alphaproteobacteria bacterium]MCB9699591.1 hypothetical protein [Alphaproteobacteria bacterium]
MTPTILIEAVEPEAVLGEPLRMTLTARGQLCIADYEDQEGALLRAIGPGGRRATDLRPPHPTAAWPYPTTCSRRGEPATFDLGDHGWLEAPGTWTVELWVDDERRAATTLTVRAPTPDEIEAITEDYLDSGGRPAVIAHTLFLPSLLAAASSGPEDRATRAAEAIAAVPTVTAAEHLLALADEHDGTALGDQLQHRLRERARLRHSGWPLAFSVQGWTIPLTLAIADRGWLELYRPIPPDWMSAESGPLPLLPTPAQARAVAPLVGEPGVGERLEAWLASAEEGPWLDALVDEAVAASPERLPAFVEILAPRMRPDALVELIVDRADPDRPDPRLLWALRYALDLSPCGSWSWKVSGSGGARVLRAWEEVLQTRRAELEAGPLPWEPGSTDDLLPPSLTCGW